MDPGPGAVSVELLSVKGARAEEAADLLAAEEPLEIRVEGPARRAVQVAVTMRTPGHDLELALGFLRTEGLIGDAEALGEPPVRALQPLGAGNLLTLRLRRDFDEEKLRRNFFATSSCGICGKASIDQVELGAKALPPGPVVDRAVLAALPPALAAAQAVFARTGGLHATGLFDTEGRLLCLREDVGRHNAFDKVVGWALQEGLLPLGRCVALVSGRASFEIVQKAAMAGVPLLCAVSAPSSLAVDAARRLGMTLVGFLRGERFNVYTHPARIALVDAAQGAG